MAILGGINVGACQKITAQSTHGTAGTRKTHTHTLGYVPNYVIIQTETPDADGALTVEWHVSEVEAARSATTFTTRGGASTVTFTAYVG